MYDLKDKVVVITGAAKGIGAALVREILKEGAKQVRILDVDVDQGVLLQDELNLNYGENKVRFVKCDVTKKDQFFQALDATKEENGYIDLLVNNAGVSDESNLTSIRMQIEINFLALVNGTLKAIELMSENTGGRGGAVINVSSVIGLYPICPPLFMYSSTKSAVLQFSTCIGRYHCVDSGVRVMSVCYGITDTNILNTLNCFKGVGDQNVQSIIEKYPSQSAQTAARGTIEVFQKGESASVWLVHNSKPAQDITPALQKIEAALRRVLKGLAEE